jgi:transcriptional regulator with XRE-family HTH domain
MTETRDIILKLKAVRDEKGYSYTDILSLMEKNGDFLSKSTLSRVFAEGSEDLSFKYEETIRPIAKALLDMETIEEDDDMDVRAMKSLLKYKIERIEELEAKIRELAATIDREKVKAHEKLDKERDMYNRRVDFLKEQISLKDKRMDQLMEAVFKKDAQHAEMLEKLLVCQACPMRKTE